MKKLIAVLCVIGCSSLQQAKDIAESDTAADLINARDAICKMASHMNGSDPEVAAVQNMCATDATLKQIAAKYADDECEAPELPASPFPAVPAVVPSAAPVAAPTVSSGL